MLADFVNEAFSAIYDVAKPAVEVIDQAMGNVEDEKDLAPARFAAGYLAELTG